jgi:hypothetical protein
MEDSTWQTHWWGTHGSGRVRLSVASESDWPMLVPFVQRVKRLADDRCWSDPMPSNPAKVARRAHWERHAGIAFRVCALPTCALESTTEHEQLQ